MVDFLTPAERRERMSRIPGKNTKPEMIVRRLIHGMGYRYRLHGKDLPGKPDLVFPRRRKVIFVNGCFWHQHDCPRGAQIPKTRQQFWFRKLERNKARDREKQEKIKDLGWEFLVIWECETKKINNLKTKLFSFIEKNT